MYLEYTFITKFLNIMNVKYEIKYEIIKYKLKKLINNKVKYEIIKI